MELVESESAKSPWETWLATELAAPMSVEWIEDDLEKTPVADLWVVEEDGTIASESFQWSVPDAGTKERWRVG